MAETALGVAMSLSVTTLPRTLYAAIKMEGDASIPMLLFALDLTGEFSLEPISQIRERNTVRTGRVIFPCAPSIASH